MNAVQTRCYCPQCFRRTSKHRTPKQIAEGSHKGICKKCAVMGVQYSDSPPPQPEPKRKKRKPKRKASGKVKSKRVQRDPGEWMFPRNREYVDGLTPLQAFRSRPAWVKSMSVDYYVYINSKEWRAVREMVLLRDGHACVDCFAASSLHVHHMHYRTLGFETGEELVTLCARCHERIHAEEGYAAKPLPTTPSPAPRVIVRKNGSRDMADQWLATRAHAAMDAECAERIAREP